MPAALLLLLLLLLAVLQLNQVLLRGAEFDGM